MRALICALACAVLCAACGGNPHAGMDPSVARRHVALDGAANFRDLGGYATVDGRTVRWGQLYRSDHLAELSPGDIGIVSDLGIQLVCDFRGDDERAAAPDRLPRDPAPALALLPISDESFSAGMLRDQLTSGDADEAALVDMMTEANRSFAGRYTPRYRALFERLQDPVNLPLLVHCTGGKDRAGFASAIILRSLGVPAETTLDDYLLTNHYTARKIDRMLLAIRVSSFFRRDPEPLRAVMGVRREYLQAAFDQIEADHGSFDVYLRDALGLGDRERAELQSRLLE